MPGRKYSGCKQRYPCNLENAFFIFYLIILLKMYIFPIRTTDLLITGFTSLLAKKRQLNSIPA